MSDPTKTLEACRAVGMGDDVRLFVRRARFAGWHPARFDEELKVPEGLPARFAADVRAGVAVDLDRRIDRYMRDLLIDGPIALAKYSVEQLATFVNPKLQAEALTYDPFTAGGRLIAGPTGVGKSVAGIAVLRRMHGLQPANMNKLYDEANDGNGCAWVRAFELPNARLENRLGDGEAELVTEAIKARFLVLDDLGWESKRAGADDVVVEVIAARYDAGRPTYATTGLTLPKFTDRYGTAIGRRLTDAGGLKGTVVNLWPAGGAA